MTICYWFFRRDQMVVITLDYTLRESGVTEKIHYDQGN